MLVRDWMKPIAEARQCSRIWLFLTGSTSPVAQSESLAAVEMSIRLKFFVANILRDVLKGRLSHFTGALRICWMSPRRSEMSLSEVRNRVLHPAR